MDTAYQFDEIKNFMETNLKCAQFIARNIPLFDDNEEMSIYFKYIIESYGHCKDVLKKLRVNICTFSFIESPYAVLGQIKVGIGKL